MSGQKRTTVFEMREMADGSRFKTPVGTLIRAEMFDKFPHRNYDQLKQTLDNSGTLIEAAKQLDCDENQVRKWAEVYGIDYELDNSRLSQKLEEIGASEDGGETA